MTTISEFR